MSNASFWRKLIAVLFLVGMFSASGALDSAARAQDNQPVPAGEAKDGKDKKGAGGLFDSPIMPMLLIMVVFFFLIILPAQRREKKQRELVMSTLKKNDEVVTSSGIIGVVHSIKEGTDEVTLKIDDNARLRVLKSSIAKILTKEEAKDAPANTEIKPA